MTIYILETTDVVPSINLSFSFAVREKITADSTEGLALYSGSVFSVQFSKERFLFLHYFQMHCTTGEIRGSSCFLFKYIYVSLMSFYYPSFTIKSAWCTEDIL